MYKGIIKRFNLLIEELLIHATHERFCNDDSKLWYLIQRLSITKSLLCKHLLITFCRKNVVVLIAILIGDNMIHCGGKQHHLTNLLLKHVVKLNI